MSDIEDIAKIIDPEAFGLPTPYDGDNWMVDRDEARDKAKRIRKLLAAEIERLRAENESLRRALDVVPGKHTEQHIEWALRALEPKP